MKDGIVRQRPVRELEERERRIRTEHMRPGSDAFEVKDCEVYDLTVREVCENKFRAVLAEELVLEHRDGRFERRFKDQDKGAVSVGCGTRYVDLEHQEDIRVLTDGSYVEVCINGGD